MFNITSRSLYTGSKDYGTNRIGNVVGFRPGLNVLRDEENPFLAPGFQFRVVQPVTYSVYGYLLRICAR